LTLFDVIVQAEPAGKARGNPVVKNEIASLARHASLAASARKDSRQNIIRFSAGLPFSFHITTLFYYSSFY